MNYLIFDTETTGLPQKYQAPYSDLENWPRVVQLAWVLANGRGEILEKHSYIIKPVDFIIPEAASLVHGIDTETALKNGRDLQDVLTILNFSLSNDLFLVGHNVHFDYNVLSAEFLRAGLETNFFGLSRICTMQSGVPLCSFKGGKYPKLQELYFCLFQEEFSGAHDALNDVLACSRCFFELKKRGFID